MNVFFTCKNTLVILLQLYRLYVVYSENNKKEKKKKLKNDFELTNISIISKGDIYKTRRNSPVKIKDKNKSNKKKYQEESESSDNSSGRDYNERNKKLRYI